MSIIVRESCQVPVPVPYPSPAQIFEAMEEFLRLQLFIGDGPFEGYFLDEERGIHREGIGVVPSYISAWTKPIEGLEPCNVVVRWLDTRHDVLVDGKKGSIIYLKIEQW